MAEETKEQESSAVLGGQNERLVMLVADVRDSLESINKSHNEDPDGVDGWEIGLALARLKAVEIHISGT